MIQLEIYQGGAHCEEAGFAVTIAKGCGNACACVKQSKVFVMSDSGPTRKDTLNTPVKMYSQSREEVIGLGRGDTAESE